MTIYTSLLIHVVFSRKFSNYLFSITLSTQRSNLSSSCRPIKRSSALPFLNTTSAGIVLTYKKNVFTSILTYCFINGITSYFAASSPRSSMFTFATLTFPLRLATTFSKRGSRALQGPHQLQTKN